MIYSLLIKTKAFTSFLSKRFILLIAGVGSILLGCFEKYFFSDWELLRWMVVLMSLESASSLYRDFRKKQLSRESFDGMLHKSVIYGFMLILYHILKNYTIGGDHPFELDLPSRYLVMAIVLRESFSVMENLAGVTSLIPEWLMDRMKLLSEKGFEENKTANNTQ